MSALNHLVSRCNRARRARKGVDINSDVVQERCKVAVHVVGEFLSNSHEKVGVTIMQKGHASIKAVAIAALVLENFSLHDQQCRKRVMHIITTLVHTIHSTCFPTIIPRRAFIASDFFMAVLAPTPVLSVTK